MSSEECVCDAETFNKVSLCSSLHPSILLLLPGSSHEKTLFTCNLYMNLGKARLDKARQDKARQREVM